MTAAEIVDAIAGDPTRAKSILRQHQPTPGISAAFFGHVLRLFAADHATLCRLTGAARVMVQGGDDPALDHRSLAIVLRAQGCWLASAREFVRAGETSDHPRDRLAFQTGAIDGLARSGRVDAAISLAERLRTGLSELGETALAARVSLNLGYALMQQDRYTEAISTLKGVPETLEGAGYLTDAASAHLALSTSLLFGGDLSDAHAEGETALQRALDEDLLQLADIAQGNVAYADLLRGDADLAVQSLLDLRERQRGAPIELARTLEYLGDAYATMNLWEEATDTYREALETVEVQPLHRAHLRLGLGKSLIAAGQVAEGRTEASRAAAAYGRLGNLTWQAAALTLTAVTRAQRRKALATARASGSERMLLSALVTESERGGGEESLAEAEQLAPRVGSPGTVWRLHAERARRSAGEERLREFRKMFEAMLAEQVQTSSFAARGAFLRDKESAVREYLSDLITKADPNLLQEAREVVASTRAVALLDELVQANRGSLSQEVRDELLSLRAELGEPDAPGSRRQAPVADNLDRLQRRWIEGTHRVLDAIPTAARRIAKDTATIVELGGQYLALSESGSRPLPLSAKEFDAKLRWLSYEILAPMVDRDAPADTAERALRDLAQAIVPALGEAAGVSPDGALWRAPWSALIEDRILEVRLHPGFSGTLEQLPGSRIAIWVAEHSDLPWAKHEVEALGEAFPEAEIYRSASEARACLQEGEFDALHVISHARHRARNPMFSSLDFPDGSIFAAEIGRGGLRPTLVTLSGCDTGRLSDVNRLEPDGLARAFLACGARTVVGSAWPLDDEAAARLHTELYRSLASGEGLHPSLRKARQSVRNWRAHPYFWASPVVYGGYIP